MQTIIKYDRLHSYSEKELIMNWLSAPCRV